MSTPPLSTAERLLGKVAAPHHPGTKPRRHRRLSIGSGPLVERVAVVLAILIVILAIIGPYLAPHDPYTVNLPDQLKPPGSGHWLGTDVNGRDILSRVLTGARVTLLATAAVLAFATVVGVLIG